MMMMITVEQERSPRRVSRFAFGSLAEESERMAKPNVNVHKLCMHVMTSLELGIGYLSSQLWG